MKVVEMNIYKGFQTQTLTSEPCFKQSLEQEKIRFAYNDCEKV